MRTLCPLARRQVRRQVTLALLAGGGLFVAAPSALSAPPVWPTRPVTLLVGFPVGSTPDMAARVLSAPLASALGQPVVVENHPGASGNLAADRVAKATDDHTLGIVINGNLTSAKMLNPKLPFDPAKDFSLLSLVATAPVVLVAPANLAIGDDFFLAARNAGSKWSYGSVGVGSVGHLGMEYIKGRAGNFEAVHLPYDGSLAVVTALLGGQIQMALLAPGNALPQVKAGKLRAIGLGSGRNALAPGVAPLTDLAGLRMSDLEVWLALVGPAGLSAAAQQRLAREVPLLVRTPDIRQRLFDVGWSAQGTTPEALRRRVQTEAHILGGVILLRGIKPE